MTAPPALAAPPAPIPVRMLNEWTYCPRLGVLMWVHAEFAHSADTVEGVAVHARADAPTRDLPPPEQLDEDLGPRRSLWLTSEGEGLTARMDVVEVDGGQVVPVDYKRGAPPDVPEGAWEPERVQLCAQGLVLRDAGYPCTRGYLYFAGARRRVEVAFDDALVARTRELAAGFRAAAAAGELPPPLVDSPKCPRCSLVGICLPDETRLLSEGAGAAPADDPRHLLAPRTDALPLYVSDQGARIGVSKERFVVHGRDRAALAEVRVRDTASVNVLGMVQVSTQALRAAMDAGIPVCFFTFGGWFTGMAQGHPHKNIVVRQAQFAAAADPARCLDVARAVVRSKIRNQRTLLRRNHPDPGRSALAELARLATRAGKASSLDTLLGLEGAAARLYFSRFPGMLKATDGLGTFDFEGRNRRPPRDPVNALLSYAYSLLARDLTVTAAAAGLDPYMGLYHAPRYGRPALALDLMEEVRPLVADSVVLMAINNGEVTAASFVRRADGCQLTQAGRRAFLDCYERRMDQLLTHPLFGYRASWRRVLDIQTRLFGRYLLGEVPAYVPIETR